MNIDTAIAIAKQECKDPYAQTYLRAIPKSIELFGTEGFVTQILYAKANMQTWRGETARQVKQVITSYLKSKKV